MRAIYKPRAYGDAGGWHRTPMEWVAYRLNVLLGLDYVPPVAYRQAAGGWACAEAEEAAAAGVAVCQSVRVGAGVAGSSGEQSVWLPALTPCPHLGL